VQNVTTTSTNMDSLLISPFFSDWIGEEEEEEFPELVGSLEKLFLLSALAFYTSD
jgi:hypothetical protein